MSGDGTTRTHTLREFNFRGVAQTHTVRDESRRFNGNQQVGKCPSPSQEENWVGMVGGSPPKADLALILPTPSGLSSVERQAFADPRLVCAHLALGDPRRFAGLGGHSPGRHRFGYAAEGLSSAAMRFNRCVADYLLVGELLQFVGRYECGAQRPDRGPGFVVDLVSR